MKPVFYQFFAKVYNLQFVSILSAWLDGVVFSHVLHNWKISGEVGHGSWFDAFS